MSILLIAVIAAVLVLLIGGGIAFAVALGASSKKTMATGATIPGVDVAVPSSWAGSHDPEARLHRRIRDAVAALDATIAQSGIAQIDDRARLMVSAQELDQRLVTIWALPATAKPQPLAEVEQGVAALEAAAASVALAPGTGAVGRAQDAASSIGPATGSPVSPQPPVPPVPNVTPPQAATPPDRPEPPSSLAE